MTEAILEIKNLSKSYEGKKVLDDISFKINRGELFVILGPPGSGKTTLLKIIAGLEEPESGDIFINGQNINEVPPQQRPLSMMFETLALYTNMTVYENIASPLIARKESSNVIDKKVKEIADLLKITHILDRRTDKLSGGERQRVALARALIKESLLYLLDEPFSNLDAKIRYALRTEFKKVKQLLGRTIILATSDPHDALTLADEVLVLVNGKMYQKGRPSDLYWKPRTLWLMKYITGNIYNEVRLRNYGGKIIIEGIESGYEISSSLSDMIKETNLKNLTIATHVDSCIISKEINACNGIKLKATFIGYEYRGSEYILYAKQGNYIFKSLLQKSTLIDLNHNEEVSVCIDSENALFFDEEGSLIM